MDWLERMLRFTDEPKNTIVMPSWVEHFTEHKKLIEGRAYLIDSIKSLEYDEKKGITVVIFKDGTVIKKKTVEGDNFDLNVGVALCLTDYLFSTPTQFHKKVQTLKKGCDSKKERKLKQKEYKQNLNASKGKKKSITKGE